MMTSQKMKRGTGTTDEHFDLVSVLYHALQGSSTAWRYAQDAEEAGDVELARFFTHARDSYNELCESAKTMLKQRLR
jgi:hypothetical protein